MNIDFRSGADPGALVAELRLLAADIESMTLFQPTLGDALVLDDWTAGFDLVPVIHGTAIGPPAIGNRRIATREVFAIDKGWRWARTANEFFRLGTYAGKQEQN